MGFMTLEHSHRADLYYARKEGVEQGEDRMGSLTAKLLEEGRTEDLQRALADKPYRDKLYREHGLI